MYKLPHNGNTKIEVMNVNVGRAREIINSHGVIDVEYQEEPIWIESIDDIKEMAHVRNLRTRESVNVPISELYE